MTGLSGRIALEAVVSFGTGGGSTVATGGGAGPNFCCLVLALRRGLPVESKPVSPAPEPGGLANGGGPPMREGAALNLPGGGWPTGR